MCYTGGMQEQVRVSKGLQSDKGLTRQKKE